MKWTDQAEAQVLVERIGQALLSSVDGRSSAAAELRRTLGAFSVSLRLADGTLPTEFLSIFTKAREAGAGLVGMATARSAASSFHADAPLSILIGVRAEHFSLIQEALILAGTSFASRTEVDAQIARVSAAFGAALERIADAKAPSLYRAMISLQAAVVRDLTERARPLPSVVTYRLPRSIPALVLANRLYGDAGRADELVAENAVRHPLFMPAVGRALTS